MIEILLIATFCIRVFPRVLYPDLLAYDTLFHLDIADRIRKRGFRFLPSLPKNMVYLYTYPQGFHFLLALIPPAWRMVFERFSSALVNTLTAGAVYCISTFIVAQAPEAFPKYAPLLATFLYAFSPAMLRLGSGPRAYSATPRVLGELLYVLHMGLSYAAIYTNSILLGACSALCMAMLLITSKFGNQVLFFFAPVIALVFSPVYLLIFTAGFVLSLALFRREPLRVLKGQFNHSYWYFTMYQHVTIGFGPRRFRDYQQSVREHAWPKLRGKKIKNFLYWCLDEMYAPHLALICFTPIFFAVFASAHGIPSDTIHVLYAWAGAGFFWFVATKWEPLLFLGEGERYLEYAYLPFVLLALIFLNDHPILLFLLVGYTFFMSAVNARRVPILLKEGQEDSRIKKEALAALCELPQGETFVMGYLVYQALYWGNKPVIGFRPELEHARLPREDFLALYAHYPLPTENFYEVLHRFAPRYILADNWALEHYISIVQDPDHFETHTCLRFRNEAVSILEVIPAGDEAGDE